MEQKTFNEIFFTMFNKIPFYKKMDKQKLLDSIWNISKELLFYGKGNLTIDLFYNLINLYAKQCAINRHSEFIDFIKWLQHTCQNILIDKAQQYATSDRLHNFNLVADKFAISPDIVCIMFMAKHLASIDDIVNNRITMDDKLIMEKFIDAINYSILLKAIYYDRRAKWQE